jgi:16S rRNA A1518/A1519 N6-dimethyltransferase RsmA/KsgA/DIM1 with predicted DNA glycosylase/AP lyase activity
MEVDMRRHQRKIPHRRAELSQHFLHDQHIARSIVARMQLPADALVIDAGAGDGALTAALVAADARVVAVECDLRLAAGLRRRFASDQRVTVSEGDFLRFALPSLPYHVVSNVPYSITAALLRKLLGAPRPPESAMLVVQREAAAKFAGTPRETMFSLAHKPWFTIEVAGQMARTDFVPVPRVESVLLRITRRDTPLLTRAEARRYRPFVESVLGHGDPMIAPALRRHITAWQTKRILRGVGVDQAVRTSQLTFEQWLTVFRFVEHECLGHDPTRRPAAA